MSAGLGERWGAFWKKLLGMGSPSVDGVPNANAGEPDVPHREPEEGPESEPVPDFAPYVVTDELDLHGFFPEQVPEVVDEFIRNAVRLGIDEVRIAHGKGRSVLKREVWKALEVSPLVREFREAPPERGGWGATLAWLAIESLEKGEES